MSGNQWKKKGLAPTAVFGLCGSVMLTALLCLALAAVIHHELLPLSAAGTCAAAAAGCSVFTATLLLSRLRGRQAMLTAGCIAGGFTLLAAIVCALGGRGPSFGPWLVRLVLSVFAGGVLGAVMSIRQNPHKKSSSSHR